MSAVDVPKNFSSWKFIIEDEKKLSQYYDNIQRLCDIVLDFEKEFLDFNLNETSKEVYRLVHSRVLNAYIVDGNIGVGKKDMIDKIVENRRDIDFAISADHFEILRNFAVEFSHDDGKPTVVDLFSMFYYAIENYVTCDYEPLKEVLKQIIPSFHKILFGLKLLEIVRVCEANPSKKHFIFERFINSDVIFSVLGFDFWEKDPVLPEKNSISKFFSVQKHFINYLRDNFKNITYVFLHCDEDPLVNEEFFFSNIDTFKLTENQELERNCISTYMERVRKMGRKGERVTEAYLSELNKKYTIFITNFKFDFSSRLVLLNPMVSIEENLEIVSRYI